MLGKTKKGDGAMMVFHIIKIVLGIMLVIWVGILSRNDLKQWFYIGQPNNIRDTISIEGEGKVIALPDIATVSIGVRTEKKTVADAQAENSKKMNAMIQSFKNLSIDPKDIETTNYSIYPIYDYLQDTGRVLRGYEVSQNIQLKIRNLDSISTVLDTAGKDGANEIGSLSFTIDEPEGLRVQAREKALANAKEKAVALSKELGVKLGKVVSFSENSGGYSPQPLYMEKAAYGIGGGADQAPNIEPGSEEVKVFVTVEYEIL